MEAVRLNAARLTKRGPALEYLGEALRLPAWWGRNLDALHDCLTESPRRLRVENPAVLGSTAFGRALRRVLEDAAAENPGLELVWESETEKREDAAAVKILFVCHGNICRSPMAEFVMKDLLAKSGLAARGCIESAATSTEEIGNPVYPPARRKLAEHGIGCAGKTARQMTREDYRRFDLLVGMDAANLRNMRRICGGDPDNKLARLMDYSDRPKDVADPWYTGDFETTWRDVSEGCQGLLEWLRANRRLP